MAGFPRRQVADEPRHLGPRCDLHAHSKVLHRLAAFRFTACTTSTRPWRNKNSQIRRTPAHRVWQAQVIPSALLHDQSQAVHWSISFVWRSVERAVGTARGADSCSSRPHQTPPTPSAGPSILVDHHGR